MIEPGHESIPSVTDITGHEFSLTNALILQSLERLVRWHEALLVYYDALLRHIKCRVVVVAIVHP